MSAQPEQTKALATVPQGGVPTSVSLRDKLIQAGEMAKADLLPAAYRNKPANVLLAIEASQALGISLYQALMGIHVIEGKASASAALISALVRRAGHRLRLYGDDKTATCEIVRIDDPSFTFKVTWTLDMAKNAGLAGKQVWKNYPGAMLKSRALTQCARDACQEALCGVQYTPEELGAVVDQDGNMVELPQAPQWDIKDLQSQYAELARQVFASKEERDAWTKAGGYNLHQAPSLLNAIQELERMVAKKAEQAPPETAEEVIEAEVVETKTEAPSQPATTAPVQDEFPEVDF